MSRVPRHNPAANRKAGGTIALTDALVDGGHLAGLTAVETKTLWVFVRHADRDEISFPGADSIAAKIGTTTSHVLAAIRSLKKEGLLVDAGYRGHIKLRQILVPPNMPDSGMVHESANMPDSGSQTSPVPTLNLPDSGNQTCPVRGDEGHKKDTRNLTRTPQEFPPELQTEEFSHSWEEWIQHRREIKKPLTPSSASKQLKALVPLGSAGAVAAIERSIAAGWQGIFPEKRSSKKNERSNCGLQENLKL